MTNTTNFNFGYRETVSYVPDPDSRNPWGLLAVFTYEKCELSDPDCHTVEGIAEFWEEIRNGEYDWVSVFGEGRETLEFSA